MQSRCESCLYFQYDEEYEQYFCDVSLDEDEMERILQNTFSYFLYYRQYDEYAIVKHQM